MAVSLVAHGQSLQDRASDTPQASTQVKGAPDGVVVLASGTSLQVEALHNYRMKAGEAIEGQLLYPIYVDGKLAVPAHTPVRGQVVALKPDTQNRWHARLRGDFTPFHIAVVRFDELDLLDGPHAIATSSVSDGAAVLQLTAPGVAPKPSLFARSWDLMKSQVRKEVELVTAPGLGDRALQMLYHQLPYHPERIVEHTAWSFELAEPMSLSVAPNVESAAAEPLSAKPETWLVRASLREEVTSAHARAGDLVEALVIEPVYDRERTLVVPQGSTLVGKVTRAKPARAFGRNGKLRFAFQSIRFPAGLGTQVEGMLAGASTEKSQDLKLDAEGTISPRSQSSAVAPLLLTALAGRALDSDGNLTLQTGVASNGFGLIGRVVGVAARDRNIAAGIGFYAAGLSFYENFLRPGHDVVFRKDTRIEIETNPMRAPVLKPQ